MEWLVQGHTAPEAWSWELIQALFPPAMLPLGVERFSRAFFPEASGTFGLTGVMMTERKLLCHLGASIPSNIAHGMAFVWCRTPVMD